MLDEKRVRQLWDEQAGAPLDDDAFEAMRAVFLGSDEEADLCFSTPQEALNAFAQVQSIGKKTFGESVDESKSVLDLEPPAGWLAFQARYFEEHFDVVDVRTQFGLCGGRLADESEIPRMIEEAAADQVWPSAMLGRGDIGNGHVVPVEMLEYPDPSCTHGIGKILVYVATRADYRLHLGSSADPAVAHRRATRLFHLWSTASMLHVLTGIRQADAVRYVLAGATPLVPWMRAVGQEYEGYGNVEIIVGSLDVEPDEVAAAYARTRRRVLGDTNERAMPWAFHRAPSPGAQVVDFCRPLRTMARPAPWAEIAERWNTAHPGSTYKNGDTLSRVYRRHLDRLEQTKGGESK